MVTIKVASICWQELHCPLSHLFHLRHLTEGGEWCAPNDKEQAIRQSGVKNQLRRFQSLHYSQCDLGVEKDQHTLSHSALSRPSVHAVHTASCRPGNEEVVRVPKTQL